MKPTTRAEFRAYFYPIYVEFLCTDPRFGLARVKHTDLETGELKPSLSEFVDKYLTQCAASSIFELRVALRGEAVALKECCRQLGLTAHELKQILNTTSTT